MILRPPRSTRTDTLFPYTTLFRSKSLVPVLNPDGSVALDHEEFPRPETTAEGLAALKPSFDAIADFDLGDGVTFRKQIQRRYPGLGFKGVHHAGNSSGVVDGAARSEEEQSELQSLMRSSYAVFCLKKNNKL